MGILIFTDMDSGEQVMVCSTKGMAFGPVIGSEYDVDDFISWLDIDPRKMTDVEIQTKLYEWYAFLEGEDDGEVVVNAEAELHVANEHINPPIGSSQSYKRRELFTDSFEEDPFAQDNTPAFGEDEEDHLFNLHVENAEEDGDNEDE